MRFFCLPLLSAVVLLGCNGEHVAAASARPCTEIGSPLERLACFDAQAGTPAQLGEAFPPAPLPAVQPQPPIKAPDITTLVQANEAKRSSDDSGLLLMRMPDALPGQYKVVISAPPLAGAQPRPYLAIACLSNISRLQLLSAEPLPVNRVHLRLLLDGRAISESRPWQVLDDGTVTDAGRGLVAIEQLRQLLRPAQQLQIQSDHALFDGLVFDVSRLAALMPQQREACHW